MSWRIDVVKWDAPIKVEQSSASCLYLCILVHSTCLVPRSTLLRPSLGLLSLICWGWQTRGELHEQHEQNIKQSLKSATWPFAKTNTNAQYQYPKVQCWRIDVVKWNAPIKVEQSNASCWALSSAPKIEELPLTTLIGAFHWTMRLHVLFATSGRFFTALWVVRIVSPRQEKNTIIVSRGMFFPICYRDAARLLKIVLV